LGGLGKGREKERERIKKSQARRLTSPCGFCELHSKNTDSCLLHGIVVEIMKRK
jgi:hypothetical protein